MTVAESIEALRELAKAWPHEECPWEERPSFRPASTAQALQEFEVLGGLLLPDDLRAFFSEVDAIVAMSVHNGYWIGGVEELSQSLRRGDFPAVIGEAPAIPVATDGGGNAFLMDATGRVWRWSQEDGLLTQISGDFASFLARVVGDFRASYSDTPGWKYLV
ncbi:SMI1/KNR4 family protein [Posidoniimonas polymericola]|nr:SMI1/KNR4 family protein [Posidoniimonas polymericola]